MEARTSFWRNMGDALIRRYAHSSWALFGLLGIALAPLTLLYLVRGVRGVQYGVAGAFGAVGVALAFAHPYYALLTSMFIAFSRLDFILPGPVAWGLLGIAASRVLFDWFHGKPLEWGSRDFRVATVLLLAAILTSLLFAYEIERSLDPLEHILIGSLTYIAISGLCTTPRRVQHLLLVAGAGFAFAVARYIIRLVSSFGSGVIFQPSGKRLGAGEVNVTAVLACCLLVPTLQLMGRMPLRHRIWILPLVLINIIAIVLSASRIGMILLVVALAYVLLRSRHRLLYLVLLAVAMAIFTLGVSPRYWTRFISLGQLADIVVDRSLLLRMHSLEVGWKIFLDHFWTGVGVGNFAAWSQRYMSIALFAHNSFLDVAATLGILGFATYVFWLGSAVGMSFAAIKRSTQVGAHLARSISLDLACVVGMFLIAAATLDLAYNPFLWLLFGCVNALRASALASAPKDGSPLAPASSP